MAFLLEGFNQLQRADFAGFIGLNAGPFHLQHRQAVQRNVGAAPGIGGGRKIIGIGFAGDLEHGDGDFFWQFGPTGKPFRLRPGGHDLFSVGVAFVGFFLDTVLVVEHQQGLRQRLGGGGRALGVIQQINQGLNVVTADHGAQQFGGSHAGNQRT